MSNAKGNLCMCQRHVRDTYKKRPMYVCQRQIQIRPLCMYMRARQIQKETFCICL